MVKASSSVNDMKGTTGNETTGNKAKGYRLYKGFI